MLCQRSPAQGIRLLQKQSWWKSPARPRSVDKVTTLGQNGLWMGRCCATAACSKHQLLRQPEPLNIARQEVQASDHKSNRKTLLQAVFQDPTASLKNPLPEDDDTGPRAPGTPWMFCLLEWTKGGPPCPLPRWAETPREGAGESPQSWSRAAPPGPCSTGGGGVPTLKARARGGRDQSGTCPCRGLQGVIREWRWLWQRLCPQESSTKELHWSGSPWLLCQGSAGAASQPLRGSPQGPLN